MSEEVVRSIGIGDNDIAEVQRRRWEMVAAIVLRVVYAVQSEEFQVRQEAMERWVVGGVLDYYLACVEDRDVITNRLSGHRECLMEDVGVTVANEVRRMQNFVCVQLATDETVEVGKKGSGRLPSQEGIWFPGTLGELQSCTNDNIRTLAEFYDICHGDVMTMRVEVQKYLGVVGCEGQNEVTEEVERIFIDDVVTHLLHVLFHQCLEVIAIQLATAEIGAVLFND